jgi:hypothetical protein
MKRTSVLHVLLAIVAVLLVAPATLSSYQSCEPPQCPETCESGTHDCTNEWCESSWEHWTTCMYLWANGYSVVVCCQD